MSRASATNDVGSLAKHLAKQKLNAGQLVAQSLALPWSGGQHGIAPSIGIAISTASVRPKLADAGLTKAARIVAVTNRARTKQCARSRSCMGIAMS